MTPASAPIYPPKIAQWASVTVVLVHDAPKTETVWDLLSEQLVARGSNDQIRLSPPGFGAVVPESWTADVYEYRDWLVARAGKIGHPVEPGRSRLGRRTLLNVAINCPDLLRTWCSNVFGIYDPDYVWHGLAQIWRTPGKGEAAVEARCATPVEEAAAGLARPAVAGVAVGFDADMGRCILASTAPLPSRCSSSSVPS